MGWQVVQVIAPDAIAEACPRRCEVCAPWQLTHEALAGGAVLSPGPAPVWHEPQVRLAATCGRESGPGAPPEVAGGTMIAAARDAAAPAAAAGSTPRKRVTSEVGSARVARARALGRARAARSRASARPAVKSDGD